MQQPLEQLIEFTFLPEKDGSDASGVDASGMKLWFRRTAFSMYWACDIDGFAGPAPNLFCHGEAELQPRAKEINKKVPTLNVEVSPAIDIATILHVRFKLPTASRPAVIGCVGYVDRYIRLSALVVLPIIIL